MLYIGEIAAIITSILFALTSTMFTLAGREVGSLVVNRLRLAGASVMVLIVHWIVLGTLWPVQAGVERWFWLGLSGIIGFVLGDAFLFQAFIWVGPRLSMLMLSLAPILAAFIAWIFLGESLSGSQILGIVVTILGLIWVVAERNNSNELQKENYFKGILFGLGAATGQALGFVMSKLGLAGNFSPLSGNYIRLISALIVIWLVAIFRRDALPTIKEAGLHPKATWKILGGAFSGPFLGVLLSLFALQNTSVGIASTLIALPPLFLLPVDFFIFKEKFGWGAIAGTGVALAGVAILFLA